MKFDSSPFLLFLGIVSASAADSGAGMGATNVQLTLPNTAAEAQNVRQGFIGFGIEMSSFPQFAGKGKSQHTRGPERFTDSRAAIDQPNNFSNNLMAAISSRTGAPVHIRVGGTSMDNTIFNVSQTEDVTATGDRDVCRLHTNFTIGSPWLAAFKSFNAGTRFTVQVPLARIHPINRIAFANACIAAMPDKTEQLDAFEIGNEPDLYRAFPRPPCGAPDRPASYGPDDYSAEWKAAAKDLSEQVGALNGEKAWYQAMTLSSGVNQNIWNVTATWNDVDKGGFVKTVSQHYYQADACGNLKDQLMNHSKTVSEMHSKLGAAISFPRKQGVPFILGEVGSAIGGGNCNPSADLYGSLGGALWTADFMLHAMAMGIQRVSMQQGTNFDISAWQPVTTQTVAKAVHGNWYGYVFAADFIGAGGDFRIHPLRINATHPDVVGYAGYNSGLLTKLAVLDMRLWNGANDNGRPAVNIELAGLDAGITGAWVSRLTAPGGSSALHNISWAGKQWTAKNDGQEPKGNNSVVVKVTNRKLAGNVTILASQALLLEMIRR